MTEPRSAQSNTARWHLMKDFDTEIPQQCGVCEEIYAGRELSFLPAMCLRDGCPGPTQRVFAAVRLRSPESDQKQEGTDG